MENSVDSYINAQPEVAMSIDDYAKQYDPGIKSYDDPGFKFLSWFTGERSKIKNEYEAYLTNLKNRNEFQAVQSARAWDKMMDDTKYQRMMKDFEAAGLNPYLLVNNGGISASSSPSSAKASYSASSKEEKNNNGRGRDIALMLLAFARIAAALL